MRSDDSLDPSKPLRDQRAERFALLVVGGARLTDAYEQVGFRRHGPNAYRYSKHEHIAERIRWLKEESANKVLSNPVATSEAVEYSRERAMKDAQAAYDLAMERKQPSAAVSAVTLMARLAGIPLDDDARDDMTEREHAQLAKSLDDPRIVAVLNARLKGTHISNRVSEYAMIQPSEIIDVEPEEANSPTQESESPALALQRQTE